MARDVLLLPNWAIIHETHVTAVFAACPYRLYPSTRNTAKTIYHRAYKHDYLLWELSILLLFFISSYCLRTRKDFLCTVTITLYSNSNRWWWIRSRAVLDGWRGRGRAFKGEKETSRAQGRTQVPRPGSLESCLHAFANIATGIGANRSEELIN